VLAYQTAYLKRYHSVEFITAVLNNRITNIDEITKYINYARKCKIEVLQPDINKSKTLFSVENEGIRFGLAAIKNCGGNAVNMIIAERENGGEFKGLNDFLKRVDLSCINKRLLESFIFGGVFDCFGAKRAQLMGVYESILDRVSADRKKAAYGQFSLFENLLEDTASKDNFPEICEYPSKQKLFSEREVLGVYVTGHPLHQYKEIFEELSFDSSQLMQEKSEEDETETENLDGKEVLAAGLLGGVKKIITKAGKEMASARLEDLYGFIDLLFFNKSYIKYREYLTDDNIVYVSGRITARDGEQPKLIVDKIKMYTENENTHKKQAVKGKLYLRFTNDKTEDVNEILQSYPGESEVIAKIDDKAMKFNIKVTYCNALSSELLAFLNKDDIIFKK